MNLNDHELMLRLQRGDVAAFELLVRRWESPVKRLLSRLAVDPSDVDDLGQETFLRVFRASGHYEERGAFSAWLYRIVINLARDASKRRRPSTLGDHQPPDREGTPASRSAQCELSACVERALASLPEKLREVLVLKHYGNLTFAQISVVLNEPASTVKSRMQVALRQLHAELEKRGLRREDLES